MPVRLTIRPPRSNEPRVVEFDDERVTLGRSSRCDIQLPFRVVSGHHLTLQQVDGVLSVRDEHSTNGTLVDGAPLETARDQLLGTAGLLEIVDLRIDVELVPDLGGGVGLDHTSTLARQMLGEALFSAGDETCDEAAHFEVVRGSEAGQKHFVPDTLDRGLIADAPDAVIRVAGLATPLEIYRDGDGFGLDRPDHTSGENRVTVAGEPLQKERRLTSGDHIVAGDVELRFVDPLEAYLEELDGGSKKVDQEIPDDLRVEADEPDEAEEADEQQDEPEQERQNPDSTAPKLGAVEVGVIAVSLLILAGVAYLLMSIFEVG